MSDTLVKEKDVIVYRNENSYSHNAVVELLQNGDLVAVVQEQKRRKYRTHIDPTSKPVLLRSHDGGNTWDPSTKTTIAAGKNEAINDPSIRQLRDGTLIVNFFKWHCGSEEEVPADHPWVRGLDGEHYAWTVGSYTTRSFDGGQTWEEPAKVPAPTGDATAVSDPIIQISNGDLMIPLYGSYLGEWQRAFTMRSSDGGGTWEDPVTVAYDPLGHFLFDEPSLLYLPSGKLICMLRVDRHLEEEYGYYLYQAESNDLGKTWTTPTKTTIWGHPPHLLHLQSGSILCVYGYRRPPYGIRACLSHDDGKTWDIQNELILRSDGIDRDVGYPTSVQLADGTIFTVWYLCEADASMGEAEVVSTQVNTFFSNDRPLAYTGATFYREK